MKLAIVGYGNLGKCLEKHIQADPQLSLAAIYSRRDIRHEKYIPLSEFSAKADCDAVLLALGSYADIMQYKEMFNDVDTVDSFDTHAKIAEYKRYINAHKTRNLSIISTGWDPGLLSLARGLFSINADAVVTLWGEGISQGHSNAVRSIRGVTDAVQFTVPKKNAEQLVANGVYDEKKLHDRICYVACNDADRQRIENEIKTMPDYFVGYDTTVIFCTPAQVAALKLRTQHCGKTLCLGKGFGASAQLSVDDNADYTACIMLAYAKAIPALKRDGFTGAADVYDIPLKYIADRALI